MAITWITDSNLGYFAANRLFATSPVIIQFSADVNSEISLSAGELPAGLVWYGYPNFIRIGGIVEDTSISATYNFTFTVKEPNGNSSSRVFIMELASDPIPSWITPRQLPTRSETYSYILNPLVLQAECDSSARITLLNGALPGGLSWVQSGKTVVITGESDNISQDLTTEWTFRITNPNKTIADRTFTLTITAVKDSPDWVGQDPFIGYIGSKKTKSFVVSASMTNSKPVVYSFAGIVPSGMLIDGFTGTIVYTAPEQIGSDQTVFFTIRARSGEQFSDLDCSIKILPIPSAPVWMTPDGLISIEQGGYLQFKLEAVDVDNRSLSYSLASATAGFPFNLDNDGFLYGEAPFVTQNQQWTIVVNAIADGTMLTTASRQFTVEVTKVNAEGVLIWRNDINEILDLADGQRVIIDVGATSTRKYTVKHGIVGGQCPPGLVLDKIQGQIVGFVDYHPVDKDYWFDIVATDDIDTVWRTVHIKVLSTYGYQFSSIGIPLTGDIRDRWIATNNYTVTNTDMHPNVNVVGNTLFWPSMNLVKGLNTTIKDPKLIIQQVLPNLQRMRLQIGSGNIAVADKNSNVLLYRNVLDKQAGADSVANHVNGLPSTVIPPNLVNLRSAFINACGFATGDVGKNASAVPTIDPEDGSITGITVINSGSGYTNHPDVTIIGSGTGAQAKADMKLIDLDIIDPGRGWKIGDLIEFSIGVYTTPAQLVVLDVSTIGGLVKVGIVDGGIYQEMPYGKIWLKSPSGDPTGVDPDLGIYNINILASGKGYSASTTTVGFSGNEKLDYWQTEWSPIIPIALVTPEYANTAFNNSKSSVARILDGFVWQVGDIEWKVEGQYWQGTTSFDDDITTWDGNTTGFEEVLIPAETIFDEHHETFDLYGTTFDAGPGVAKDARINWGKTTYDESTTAFEFYATIYDASAPPTESSTVVRKYITLQMPQLTGNNAVDTRTINM